MREHGGRGRSDGQSVVGTVTGFAWGGGAEWPACRERAEGYTAELSIIGAGAAQLGVLVVGVNKLAGSPEAQQNAKRCEANEMQPIKSRG